MATSQSADIRALLGGGADEDRVAATHLLVGAGFLVLGGLLELLAIFALRFGSLSPVSFGRLEPMANLALMVGFLVISLVGGIYYVLPRLTGARLRSPALARLGLMGLTALVLAGVVVIAFGLGDGTQPFGLPWWLDVPLAAALFAPLLNVLGTINQRRETRSYVTLWFVTAGAVWLPLLYLSHTVATLPFIDSLGQQYGELFFSAGFVTMWVIAVGAGLFYYTLVKEMDIPLASRQLAVVGLWSLGFASVWWGVAQLIFGPGPGWVDAVAAALGLAFPIGTLANAANVSMTLQGHWERLPGRPGVTAGVVGSFLAVVVAAMASLASFRAVGSVTALTGFWEAIEYAAILGVGPLLVAGVSFDALPRIVGRALPSTSPGPLLCPAHGDRCGRFPGDDGGRRDRQRLLMGGRLEQRRLCRRRRRMGSRGRSGRASDAHRLRLRRHRLCRPARLRGDGVRHYHCRPSGASGGPGLRPGGSSGCLDRGRWGESE